MIPAEYSHDELRSQDWRRKLLGRALILFELAVEPLMREWSSILRTFELRGDGPAGRHVMDGIQVHKKEGAKTYL
jgi:hypothetical protein